MKKNIIFLGKNGQIANAFYEIAGYQNSFDCQFYSSQEIDLSDLKNVETFLQKLPSKIDLLVNCMAYTNVDKAEEEQDLCDKINHQAVAVLAKYCFEKNIKLVHFSTDYVFDGSGEEAFAEDNTKNLNPVNFYGKTKLWAEKAIQKSGCDYLIIRVSWVYDNRENSKNFVNTIKKLAREKEVLTIVDDQIGSPTSAEFIARNCFKIFEEIFVDNIEIQQQYYRRILHLNNGRFVSWYEFARVIFSYLKRSQEIIKLKEILPIKTKDYKSKSERPLNNKLDSRKFLSSRSDVNCLQKKYLAIFAHYDKDNLIDDYVVYYLQHLRKVASEIIFVSDCNIPEKERSKIKFLCSRIIAQKHGEYDFGSYKRGVELFLDDMQNYDGLILANDSCFGPLHPFENIFQLMEFSDADFWGLITNQDGYLPHLQSYFLVFNHNIIRSKQFADFFKKIEKEENKNEIIKKYEVGLTQFFLKNNFKMDSYIKKVFENNPTETKKILTYIVNYKLPLLKIKFLQSKIALSYIKSPYRFDEIFVSDNIRKLIFNYIKIYDFKIVKVVRNFKGLNIYLFRTKIMKLSIFRKK